MPAGSPKKRSFISYLLYICIVILSVVVVTAYEVNREEQVNTCLQAVYKDGKTLWARRCKETAKREKRQLRNCIEEGNARTRLIYSSTADIENSDRLNSATCNRMYGESDSSADCLLPKVLADSLNSQTEKAIEICKS